MREEETGEVYFANSLDEAISILSDRERSLVPIAGGTWLMRSEKRKEALAPGFLALSNVSELRGFHMESNQISIGALTTHHDLGVALEGSPELFGLADAARISATPGVRRLATVGGNICTDGFHSPDIATALLALDAQVEVAGASGTSSLPLSEYLNSRKERPLDEILVRVMLPRMAGATSHVRLTMKSSGDYPVAIVSVGAVISSTSVLSDLRVAIGSVEETPRRWTALEDALEGQVFRPEECKSQARDLSVDFNGRDAVDAPGSYRVSVLPHLVQSALASIFNQKRGG